LIGFGKSEMMRGAIMVWDRVVTTCVYHVHLLPRQFPFSIAHQVVCPVYPFLLSIAANGQSVAQINVVLCRVALPLSGSNRLGCQYHFFPRLAPSLPSYNNTTANNKARAIGLETFYQRAGATKISNSRMTLRSSKP
jgi:hypothetical protein